MSIKYKNSDILSVSNVAGMFLLKVNDNQLVQTQGYSTEGVGANLYRYDAGSAATIDGVFTFPGIGGTLSFDGSNVFNGTAGTGRMIAVDQSVVDVTKAGVRTGVESSNAFKRAVIAGYTKGVEVIVPSGAYDLTAWTTLSVAGDLSIVGHGYPTFLGANTGFLDLTAGFRLSMSNIHLDSFQYALELQASTVAVPHIDVVIDNVTLVNGTWGVTDSATAAYLGDVTIKNCSFSQLLVAGVMLRYSNAGSITINNNEITDVDSGGNAFGIYCGNLEAGVYADSLDISQNRLDNIRTTHTALDVIGIYAGSLNANITDNDVSRVYGAAGNTDVEGIYCKSWGASVVGNKLRNAGQTEGSIVCKGQRRDGLVSAINPPSWGVKIHNNHIVYDDAAIMANYSGLGIKTFVDESIVSCNTLDACGISLESAVHSNVNHNIIYRQPGYCIGVYESNGTSIVANTIREWAPVTSPNYAIFVRSNTAAMSGVSIAHNTFIDNVTVGVGAERIVVGVLELLTGSISGMAIESNIVGTGTTHFYRQLNSVSGVMVRNNEIGSGASLNYDFSNYPALFAGNTQAAVDLDIFVGSTGTVVSPQFPLWKHHVITMTGDVTVLAMVPPNTPGTVVELTWIQDATGNRTITWPGTVVGNPQPAVAANSVSIIRFLWNGTNYLTVE